MAKKETSGPQTKVGDMIRLTDKVTIIGKRGNKHLEEGKEYEVHPTQAELLVKKGFATYPEEK